MFLTKNMKNKIKSLLERNKLKLTNFVIFYNFLKFELFKLLWKYKQIKLVNNQQRILRIWHLNNYFCMKEGVLKIFKSIFLKYYLFFIEELDRWIFLKPISK